MVGRIFLGRYEILRQLGEGGMGKVFLARQLDLGRQVVIKVMHDHVAADERFRERFQRETFLMANFEHQYAVRLYDASLAEPGPCIVMEYIRGVNLQCLLEKNGRISAPRVGRLLGQLCEVLQKAHEAGMIHRDLKPANLMIVDHDTPREKVKVMDFGLAKMIDQPVFSGAAAPMAEGGGSGEFAVGTPGYICPEQVRGTEVDHRGDLYSVGCILYELLTGRLPFEGETTMDLLVAHATEMPPRFAELDLAESIPLAVEEVVFSCLAKDPADRPQTAQDLADAYAAALEIGEAEMATPIPLGEAVGDTDEHAALAPADPTALSFDCEAWMPQSIAALKVRGFADEMGGRVVESTPGLIRVEIESAVATRSRFGWFGRQRRTEILDVELYLRAPDASRGNRLLIHALFRPESLSQLTDPHWRERCNQAFVSLRGYLMGIG